MQARTITSKLFFLCFTIIFLSTKISQGANQEEAATKIQKSWKKKLLRHKILKSKKRSPHDSALIIQRFLKKLAQEKEEKSAATKIQEAWREHYYLKPQEEVLNVDLFKGAILQSQEEGTTLSCALISIQSAYGATHSIEATIGTQKEVDEILKIQDPKYPTLKELLDYYKFKMVAFNRRNRAEEYDFKRLQSYEGLAFSSKNIGNISWYDGFKKFDMRVRTLPIKKMNEREIILAIKKYFTVKNSVLLIHAWNHYTSIGGYRVTEEGSFEIHMSFTNQVPDTWVSLSEVVKYLKRVKNSRIIYVTKKKK